MPKTKEQKNIAIKGLEQSFKKQTLVVLLDFSGVDSKTLFKLRDTLKAQDGKLEIVKKTLLKKALERQGKTDLVEKIEAMKGQLALVFGFSDETKTAKACLQTTKENEKLKIIGGILEDEFNVSSKIIELAQIPSREELLAKLVGSLQSPMAGLACSLKGVLNNLVFALNEVQKTKSN